MTNPVRTACALLMLMFVAGCGQSGPLFVPGDPSTVQPPPPQQESTQEDDEDNENGAASP